MSDAGNISKPEKAFVRDHEEPGAFGPHLIKRTFRQEPSYAAVIAADDADGKVNDILGKWQDVGLGVNITVTCTPQVGVSSYLEIKHSIKYNAPGSSQPIQKNAYMYLTEETLACMTLKEVVPEGQQPSQDQLTVPQILFDHHKKLGQRLSEQQVWQLTLSLAGNERYDANLFSVTPFGDQEAVMDKIRQHYKANSTLVFFITAFEPLTGFERLRGFFDDERKKNPYDAWYPQHPRAHYLQVGDYPKANNRPEVQRKTKTSFTSWSDYVTVLGYAAIFEHEHHTQMVATLEDQDIPLVTMTIPYADDRRFFGFITLALRDKSGSPPIKLQVGDRLDVNFYSGDRMQEDARRYWAAEVLAPNPLTPSGYVPIMLTRPYDKTTSTHQELNPELTPLDCDGFPSLVGAMNAIKSAPPRMVRILMIDSDRSFRAKINALRAMTSPSITKYKEILLSNNIASLGTVDMYQGISQHIVDQTSESAQFNPEQRQVLQHVRALHGGIGLIHGPPGTGKTWLSIRLLLPLITESVRDPMKRKQVMLVGPTNHVADHLALSVQDVISNLYPDKPIIVTRCHSLTSEEGRVFHEGSKSREKPKNARPPIINAEASDDTALLQAMTTAGFIARQHSATTHRPAGINDTRFRLIEQSLAHRMLQLAGIVDCSWSDKASWDSFRGMYVNYRDGDTFSSDDLMKLRSSIRELRDATIKRTDILVCTPFAASMTPIRENTSLDVIVVDEAARVTEPELWPLMAWYTPRVLLLVGDHHQLRPLVFSRKQQNPFVEQLQISLFTRLIWNGLPALMLLEQHRMNAALCSFISQVFYDGQLRTSNNLGQYVADVNRRFTEHNSQNNTFRLGGALLWVDVKDSAAEPDSRKVSTVNVQNAAATIAILQSMLAHNTIRLEEITVLTPYRGQMFLYNSIINMYDTLQGLRVRTVDSFHGEESGIVIFDVTGSNKLGFFTDANRLCVSLSRARGGMIIVGGFTQLAKTRPTHSGQKRKLKTWYSMMDFIRKARVLSAPNMHPSFQANMDLARNRIRDTIMPSETEDAGNSWSTNETPATDNAWSASGANEWVATDGMAHDTSTPTAQPAQPAQPADSHRLDLIRFYQIPDSFTNADILDVLAYIESRRRQRESILRDNVSNPDTNPDASLPDQVTEDQLPGHEYSAPYTDDNTHDEWDQPHLNALAHQATQSPDSNINDQEFW